MNTETSNLAHKLNVAIPSQQMTNYGSHTMLPAMDLGCDAYEES